MKIRKYYAIFVYILQGKTEKTGNENHATKVTKIENTKNQKTKIWDERNIQSKEILPVKAALVKALDHNLPKDRALF